MITSYKMYETLARLVAKGEAHADRNGQEGYKKIVLDPLERLGFTLEEAKKAVEENRPKYEAIRQAVSKSTYRQFKAGVESAWRGEMGTREALDKAEERSLNAEDLWQR